MIKKESILCFLFHFIELSKAGLPNRMNLIRFLILCVIKRSFDLSLDFMKITRNCSRFF